MSDALMWQTERALTMRAERNVGAAIRFARENRGWRLADVARRAGYSVSTISRLETARRQPTDLGQILRIAGVVGIPSDVLGELLGVPPWSGATVDTSGSVRDEEADLRRRELLAASLAVPAVLLTGMDDALAIMPEPSAPATAAALEMIGEAGRAAARNPGEPLPGYAIAVTPAHVALYEIGVHWSLGDAGAALHAARDLHPGQLPTAERRARLHTDLARAWWQWGKPEHTARSLIAAYRESPSEVASRSSMRRIADDLTARYPKLPAVTEFARLTAPRH